VDLSGLSDKGVFFFFLLVLPGFIAQSVYDLVIPSERRDASENFFLGLAYGTLNLVLTWPVITWAISSLGEQNATTCSMIGGYAELLFSLAAFPAFLGFAASRVRNWRVLKKFFLTPHATAWDSFFHSRTTCWMIFHLKDGTRIGGHYGLGSHVSTFPREPDVYVSEAWRLDDQCRFTGRVEGTLGMLIRREDCNLIEFLREE
jgi:hypothetical protein